MSIVSLRTTLNSSGLLQSNPALHDTISKMIDELELNDAQSIDSGSGYTNSGDANGTKVQFTNPFSKANVVATVSTGTKGFCSIVQISNTYFLVKAWDDTGTRISTAIQWIARGVLL